MIVNNIDIFFKPEYDIDMLGYFIQIVRNRRLIIIWLIEYILGSLKLNY